MSGVGTAPPLPTLPPSPTAFTIDINWDPSCATAPAGFTTDIVAAVRYLESEFSDPVTITIDVGYGEIGGPVPGAVTGDDLGESIEPYDWEIPYSTLRQALTTNAKTSTDASVVGSLPAASPFNNATYLVTPAQAKALGLVQANTTEVDGYVGFAPANNFTFGDSATGGYVASNTYDFFGAAVHEMTEVMGRGLMAGRPSGSGTQLYKVLDLLHYSAPGERDSSGTTPGYFSINGGHTNLGEFNTNPAGDFGDWASSMGANSFDASATPGIVEPITQDDLAEMDAIGWNPAGAAATITPVTLVTPPAALRNSAGLPPIFDPVKQVSAGAISFAAETSYLAVAQGLGGLTDGSQLVTVTVTGDAAGGKYSYALSGPGAAPFTLGATGGGAVLAAGAQGVTGAAGGKAYAMTVTATGSPSITSPVNVVVGSSGDDTIAVASLPGIVTTAPTFIYGLGGEETINGTGMSGALWFDAGTGIDTMAGGTGANVYEFAAGAGEPAAATVQDIITNFKPTVDRIDLTWVGWRFSGVGPLDASASTIAPNSVGWQGSGGNTYVYANTTNQPETLGATNVKIELEGNIALTSANFSHT